MNTDVTQTDRTLTFKVRTNVWGSKALFKSLALWLDSGGPNYRQIDMFEQRVDGIDMTEDDDDFTKELSKSKSESYGGSG